MRVLNVLNKNRDIVIYVLTACFLCGAYFNLFSLINQYFGIKDDNIVEELVEDILKEELDVDIDLTPLSKE